MTTTKTTVAAAAAHLDPGQNRGQNDWCCFEPGQIFDVDSAALEHSMTTTTMNFGNGLAAAAGGAVAVDDVFVW